MSKPNNEILKIRECDLDDSLIRTIYSNVNTTNASFINSVNSAITDLRNTKQDKDDMKFYRLNTDQTSTKIREEELDVPLATKINARIPWEKLDNALQNRLNTLRNDVNSALAKNTNTEKEMTLLRSEIDSLLVAINDEMGLQSSNMSAMESTINDFIGKMTSGGGGGTSLTSTQILNIDSIPDLKTRLDNMSSIISSTGTITNISKSQLDKDLQAKIDAISTEPPKVNLELYNGTIGSVAVTSGQEQREDGTTTTGVLHAADPMLLCRIAHSDSEFLTMVNKNTYDVIVAGYDCEFNSSGSAIHTYQGLIVLKKSSVSSGAVPKYLTLCASSTDFNSNYKQIKDGLRNSWCACHKFILDIDSGEVLYNIAGRFAKIYDVTNMKLIEDGLKTVQSDITSLKSKVTTLESDVKTLKSDVSTLKSDVATLKTKVK